MTPQPRRPDGTSEQACVWCFRAVEPVRGVYLELLYPGQTTCTGCGRRQLHCTCEPIAKAKAA